MTSRGTREAFSSSSQPVFSAGGNPKPIAPAQYSQGSAGGLGNPRLLPIESRPHETLFLFSWGPDDDGKTVDGPHQLGKVRRDSMAHSLPCIALFASLASHDGFRGCPLAFHGRCFFSSRMARAGVERWRWAGRTIWFPLSNQSACLPPAVTWLVLPTGRFAARCDCWPPGVWQHFCGSQWQRRTA